MLPVQTLAALAVRPGGRYIDGTLGLGGHAAAVLDQSAPDGRLLGIDADPDARRVAAERLARYGERVTITAGNHRAIVTIARAAGFDGVDGVLFDLGVSSLQLGPGGRGFSFRHDTPLDMRMDPALEDSAADIVNTWDATALADVLYRYGDERLSRRIAAAIVAARPIATTTELAAVVARAAPAGVGRIHPATRTFQALRIAVNDELAALREALDGAVAVLAPGGRLVVISFHSGEDRIVKEFIRQEARGCRCPPGLPACVCGRQAQLKPIGRGVVVPDAAEAAANPRSRSAKLRAAERLPDTS